MFLSIGMLKLNYFLADIFILSAEKQPIKLSWRKIECLPVSFCLRARGTGVIRFSVRMTAGNRAVVGAGLCGR